MDQAYVSPELTHFVGGGLRDASGQPKVEEQFQLLLNILQTGWLRPSHYERLGVEGAMFSDTSKPLSTNERLGVKALCFCDIPKADFRIHMDKYSHFGVAFTKFFLLRKGASPVYYVARDAAPHPVPGANGPRDLGEAFDRIQSGFQTFNLKFEEYVLEDPEVRKSDIRPLVGRPSPGAPRGATLLGELVGLSDSLDRMLFANLKFFSGEMTENHKENFYMEREWRMMKGLRFRLDEIARVIVPPDLCPRFKQELPDYTGEVN